MKRKPSSDESATRKHSLRKRAPASHKQELSDGEEDEEFENQSPDPIVEDEDQIKEAFEDSADNQFESLREKVKERPRKATKEKGYKGFDQNLPPLDTIHQIIVDLVIAAGKLGLFGATADLKGLTLRIATMCSGTESPLVALQLISEGTDSA